MLLQDVRLSVTRQYCVETAKRVIKLFHCRVATILVYGNIPLATPHRGH